MASRKLLEKYYPSEKYNGTKIFYDWIADAINNNCTILNFGAGTTSIDKAKSLKGKVETVYGVDIDERVLTNKDLDTSLHLKDDLLPFEDNFFDLVFSDFVLEHLANPKINFKEIYRVLKPNSSFYFRTPNLYHYVSVISKFTPHWFHLMYAKNMLEDHEPHKTYYKANSEKNIIKLAKEAGFKQIDLRFVEFEPSYLLFNRMFFYLGLSYERLVNKFQGLHNYRANIFGKLTK